MKRWMAGLVIAVFAVLGMPTAASADRADCAGNGYTDGAYEYFEPERRFVPPPLRSIPWDCAIRPQGEVFVETLDADGGYLQSVQYTLFYVDFTLEDFVALLRAFEASGFSDRGDINIVENGTGGNPASAGLVADGPPADVLHPYVLERTYGAPLSVLQHGGMPVVLEHQHGLHERLQQRG